MFYFDITRKFIKDMKKLNWGEGSESTDFEEDVSLGATEGEF